MPRLPAPGVAAAALLATAGEATAHGFGRLYNLPVPFWLYGWAAASVLVLSFLLVGFFASAPAAPDAAQARERDLTDGAFGRALRRLRPALRWFAVGLLLLCIATGFFGNRDPYRNFSMTFFWVVFTLGGTYLAALIGDAYGPLNPWRSLTDGLGRLWRGYSRGRVRYPETLGDLPALAFYLVFIWFELFGHGKPASLAAMLTAYTAVNLAGVWLLGTAAWFRHCEFFALFLRLLGHLAPLELQRPEQPGGRTRLRLRWPFAGLLTARPAHASTVLFALAMLATTAFDGLRATQWWVGLFWRDPSGLVTAFAGGPPIQAYAWLRPWYIAWETVWLLLAPMLYALAYLACIVLAWLLTGRRRPLRALAMDFGYTLLPIAVVYHLTHYSTLLLTQGLKIVSLVSDPFGRGWNLFGTARMLRAPILPDMGLVWHTQVGLILFGHVVSVYIAHRIALRVFPNRGLALASQLPMLALMIAFTVAGLWILAQPLTAELMR